jgi:hypothetical protein
MCQLGQVVRIIVLSLALGCASGGAVAGEPISLDAGAVAIGGYDTVAYFTEGEATRGVPRFEHEWRDAKWWFASAEHRELFIVDPNRYAPRFGGFCIGGMAMGVSVKADPKEWTIVDGRLYLTSTKGARERLLEDPQAKIEQAEANWKEFLQFQE